MGHLQRDMFFFLHLATCIRSANCNMHCMMATAIWYWIWNVAFHFYEQIATSCWNTIVLTQTFDFDDVSLGSLHDFSCSIASNWQAAGWEDRGDSSDRICCHSDRNKCVKFWGFGMILCVCFSSPFGVGFLDQHQIPPIWCSGFNGTQSRQAKQDTHTHINTKNFGKATSYHKN